MYIENGKMIQGQEQVYKEINNYISLPHSILLIGEIGSGKQEICEYIAEKFDLQLFDLTKLISKEFIDEINDTQTRSLYIINLQDVGTREQNILLKLYEEPNPSTYIILKTVSENDVLETIISRSHILKMKQFSKELLEPLVGASDKSYILEICTTPGQIEIANHTDMQSLKQLCDTLISRLSDAPLFNTLSVSNKINFTDEYDKFDLLLFTKVLNHECLALNSFKLYSIYKKYDRYIWNMNDKKSYFEAFLLEAWSNYH